MDNPKTKETVQTVRRDIKTRLDAEDELSNAHKMIEFLQGMMTLSPNGIPDTTNMSGLYYILQDIKDRINDSLIVLENTASSKVEA